MPTNPCRRTVLRSASASLVCVGMMLGGAACSDSPAPKANALVSDAKKAATSARTANVVISSSTEGITTMMTVAGALDGSNQHQRQKQGDAVSEGLIIGAAAYLKANSQYWQQIGLPAETAEKLKTGWWQGDGTTTPAVDVRSLLSDFFASAEGKKLATDSAKVSESTTNGTATYTISDPKASGNAQLVVERAGTHRIVEITNYSSSLTQARASYVFSRWNAVETFKAPAGAQPATSVLGG